MSSAFHSTAAKSHSRRNHIIVAWALRDQERKNKGLLAIRSKLLRLPAAVCSVIHSFATRQYVCLVAGALRDQEIKRRPLAIRSKLLRLPAAVCSVIHSFATRQYVCLVTGALRDQEQHFGLGTP